MNIEAQKSELIDWIMKLKDPALIEKILLLKKQTDVKQTKKREFGSGKHIFTYVAEDFNEPLDDLFTEYTK